jgi:hypothetical protein
MGQDFHTEFEYADAINKGITIQNSYPRGGQKYTDPNNGQGYIYLIFWTRISNRSASNLELEINFSNDTFTIPSSPNTLFNVYLPKEKMTLEKEQLIDYGLDLKLFLDKNIDQPSELIKTIQPNDSYLFYTVAISNQGINGIVRTGFELEGEDLIYKINNHKINCGEIIAKN